MHGDSLFPLRPARRDAERPRVEHLEEEHLDAILTDPGDGRRYAWGVVFAHSVDDGRTWRDTVWVHRSAEAARARYGELAGGSTAPGERVDVRVHRLPLEQLLPEAAGRP
jgi:hypothetical protein